MIVGLVVVVVLDPASRKALSSQRYNRYDVKFKKEGGGSRHLIAISVQIADISVVW